MQISYLFSITFRLSWATRLYWIYSFPCHWICILVLGIISLGQELSNISRVSYSRRECNNATVNTHFDAFTPYYFNNPFPFLKNALLSSIVFFVCSAKWDANVELEIGRENGGYIYIGVGFGIITSFVLKVK